MLKKQLGSALIIVLLMTLIVVGAVIAMVSNTMVLSRKGTGYERMAYADLLSADAGLNTFSPRVSMKKYTGRVDDIDCFVQGTRAANNTSAGTCNYTAQIPNYTLPNGASVAVRVVGVYSAQSTITVQATSTMNGVSKSLLQDFQVTRPPTTNLSIPAALTSFPSIDLGGNGQLLGAPGTSGGINTTDNGIIPGLTRLTSNFNYSSSPVVAVANDAYVTTGSFLRINGYTMQVTGRAAGYSSTNRVYSVTQVPGGVPKNGTPSGSGSSLSGDSVDLVQFAVRSAPQSVTTSTARIPISDPTGFFVNDVIYFRSGTTMYSAQVTNRGYTTDGDLNSGYLDIMYPATAVGKSLTGTTAATSSAVSAINIGTGISRYVPGASSAGAIGGGGSSTLLPSGAPGNTNILSGENLFKQTFSGKSKRDVYNLANRYDVAPSPVPDQVNWVGPAGNYGTTSTSYSLTSGYLCGTGILIVTGSLTLNGTCNAGFTGLLYVMGDLSNQGNSNIRGAVVVEGQVISAGTKVKGTMNITYDPAVFLERGRHLAQTSINPVTATWRQQ